MGDDSSLDSFYALIRWAVHTGNEEFCVRVWPGLESFAPPGTDATSTFSTAKVILDTMTPGQRQRPLASDSPAVDVLATTVGATPDQVRWLLDSYHRWRVGREKVLSMPLWQRVKLIRERLGGTEES